MNNELLAQADPEISAAINDELTRQRNTLELIASENIPSLPVIETMGTILTNKYAEGYPGKRYYGGCANVDTIETIARNRACEVFGAKYANVQPHSGVCANSAAYFALLDPGAIILGMSLSAGGHLSHGAKFSLSGRFYDAHSYGLNPETERIDMDEVRAIAREVKPDLIVAGASAYPRIIDFEAFAEIAHEVGAYLMVDMAHIAGLVAGGAHPSPVPHADIVTSTSHKTLRGPRGGFMVTNNEEIYDKYNKAVFPGWQGGPLMHVIAAKAVAFGEAAQPSFSEYAHAGRRKRRRLGRGLGRGRPAPRFRRHRQSPVPRRPHARGHHRQGGRGVARAARHNDQQERHSQRSAPVFHHERRARGKRHDHLARL